MKTSSLVVPVCLTLAAGVAHAQVLFNLPQTNATGTVQGEATPNGGGPAINLIPSTVQNESPTSANGQTGGGILDTDGMHVEAQFTADIVSSFLPGTELRYAASALAQFDTLNFTGEVDLNLSVYLHFTIPEDVNYSITQSGTLNGFSFARVSAPGVPITGSGVLLAGDYQLYHNVVAVAGTGVGQSAETSAAGSWTLFLNGGVPSPGPAAAILLGCAFASRRRRPLA